jgi:hypothetical protein
MKPSVSLIEGLHITAADKRNIIAGIEYLRTTFSPFVEASPQTVPNYAGQWFGRKGSKKRYSLTPCSDTAGHYGVIIRERETNDYGTPFDRDWCVTIAVAGLEPLHLPTYQTASTG